MNHIEKATLYGNAASYIEDHGWTRGKFVNERGEACLVGAIHNAGVYMGSGNREFVLDILPELHREIPKISLQGRLIMGSRFFSVTSWNDLSFSSRPVIKLLRHLEAMHAVAALEDLNQEIELLQLQLNKARWAQAVLEKENAELRRGLKLWKAVAKNGHDYDRDIADLEEELRSLSSTYTSLAGKVEGGL